MWPTSSRRRRSTCFAPWSSPRDGQCMHPTRPSSHGRTTCAAVVGGRPCARERPHDFVQPLGGVVRDGIRRLFGVTTSETKSGYEKAHRLHAALASRACEYRHAHDQQRLLRATGLISGADTSGESRKIERGLQPLVHGHKTIFRQRTEPAQQLRAIDRRDLVAEREAVLREATDPRRDRNGRRPAPGLCGGPGKRHHDDRSPARRPVERVMRHDDGGTRAALFRSRPGCEGCDEDVSAPHRGCLRPLAGGLSGS